MKRQLQSMNSLASPEQWSVSEPILAVDISRASSNQKAYYVKMAITAVT